jgi:hypothetical protein
MNDEHIGLLNTSVIDHLLLVPSIASPVFHILQNMLKFLHVVAKTLTPQKKEKHKLHHSKCRRDPELLLRSA